MHGLYRDQSTLSTPIHLLLFVDITVHSLRFIGHFNVSNLCITKLPCLKLEYTEKKSPSMKYLIFDSPFVLYNGDGSCWFQDFTIS